MAEKSTFESDMKTLENLVNSMADANLEDMVDMYAKASKLLIKCQNELNGFRAKIEQISSDGSTESIDI